MAKDGRTDFAPAERAAPQDLGRQRGYFADHRFPREFIDFVPDTVIVLNGCRQIVYANRVALDLAGRRDLSTVAGLRPGEFLGCAHADDGPDGCGTSVFCRYCKAVHAILASQAGQPAVEECRITVRRDGDEKALDLRVWATPFQTHDEPFTFFAIADIADEKRRFFLERIFLHDIMNTVVTLRIFSQLLGAGEHDAGARSGLARQIGFLSNRLMDEIEAHRQIVAAEHNELLLNPGPVNSGRFLQGLVNTYAQPDLLGSRRLLIAEGSAEVDLETDAALLGRVLGNMVKNAIEASAGEETVTLGCRREDSGVVFWVHNLACLPEHVRLQMFNRSFSTKGAGRGLGTYSMKHLTEKYLGGRVSFTSTEAEGTTFMARYPLVLPRESRTSTARHP